MLGEEKLEELKRWREKLGWMRGAWRRKSEDRERR